MTADEIERLLVRVEANAEVFERQTKQINRSLGGMRAEVRKTRDEFKRQMDAVGRDVYMPIQAASAIALGAITGLSINAAKRAEAVRGAFTQTFRDMPTEARAAVDAIVRDFQRLGTDIEDNFTQLRSVLTALGVDAEQSLAIVDALQRRSLDIGAFRDVSDAEAFRAVISGITGETEPLKRFGIVVNETAVKAELLRMGFKGNAEQASEAAKVVARANIVLRQSAEMHGQVAREASTLTEQEKRARVAFVQAAEDLGSRFLPVAADVLEWAVDAVDAFNDLPDGVQNAGLALLALVAASGPIAGAIKGLQALIAAANAARVAVAAVGASGAAGAVGGAAAGAGAAGRVLGVAGAGAAVGAGVLLYQTLNQRQREQQVTQLLGRGSTRLNPTTGRFDEQRLPGASDAELDAALRTVRGSNDHSWRSGGYEARIRSEVERRARAAQDQAAAAAVADAGDFGLSEAQQRGTGGGSRGGGSNGRDAANAADRVAEARAALDLERAIAVARASGDEASVRAAEERVELANLVRQYEAAGSSNAQGEATQHLALLNRATELTEQREEAERQVDIILEGRQRQLERDADYQQLMNDRLFDQLSMQQAIAAARGDQGLLRAAERDLWIADRINELLRLRLAMTQEAAEAIASGEFAELENADAMGRFRSMVVSAGEDFGSLAGRAGDVFKRRALEGFADYLFNLLNSSKGGGGIGGFLSTGLDLLLGRTSPAGTSDLSKLPGVGKSGLMSSVASLGISAGAAKVTQNFHVNAQGAIMAEGLVSELKAVGARQAAQAGVAAAGYAKADTLKDLNRRAEYSPR